MKLPTMFAANAVRRGHVLTLSAAMVFAYTTTGTTFGQIDTTHQHPSSAIIDGSTHPELIPDTTAYRLYFLMLGTVPDATDAERTRHAVQLKKLALGSADQQAVIAILTGFKQQYRLLVDAYNQDMRQAEAMGRQADLPSFRTKRDQLVQATVTNLKGELTVQGWITLADSVRDAKLRMQISVSGGAQ
jgi:hypothetical protein